jgi:hypothetical protein
LTFRIKLIIQFGEQPEQYMVYDAEGRLVLSGQMSSMNTHVGVQVLSRGLYQVHLKYAEGKTSRKSFVKMD